MTNPVTDEEVDDLRVEIKTFLWGEIGVELSKDAMTRLAKHLLSEDYRKAPPLPTTAEEQELLTWCRMIMGTFDPLDYVYVVARALKARIERGAVVGERAATDVKARQIGPSNIQERFFSMIQRPAWKDPGSWDAVRQQVRDDMLEEIHHMLKSLPPQPPEV